MGAVQFVLNPSATSRPAFAILAFEMVLRSQQPVLIMLKLCAKLDITSTTHRIAITNVLMKETRDIHLQCASMGEMSATPAAESRAPRPSISKFFSDDT